MEPSALPTPPQPPTAADPARHHGPTAATLQTRDGANVVVPPYWQRRLRSNSSLSQVSFESHNAHIRLEDHTEESSEQSKALWARSAHIDDYVIIRGATPGIGDYVVWNCTVETINVCQNLLVSR